MPASRLLCTESDLEMFFGVGAERMDADVPWPYNGLTFVASDDSTRVRCVVFPAYPSLELSIAVGGTLFYQYKSSQLSGLLVHHDGGRVTLEARSSDSSTFVRLRPSLLITQQVDVGA
jgi:hypothetical protein